MGLAVVEPSAERNPPGTGDSALFERLAECAPSLTMVIDEVGTIREVRGNTEAFSGFTAAELKGTNILDHLDPTWDPLAFDSVGAALSGHGLRRPMLFRIIRKNGQPSVIEATANSQLDDPVIGGLAVYVRRWDERWLLDQVLDAIAGAAPLEHTLELLVQVMGAELLEADGAVLYDWSDGRLHSSVSAPALSPMQAGRVDVAGAPWALAMAAGEPCRVRTPDLPPPLQAEAEANGHMWCWAYPVSAPSGPDACLVLWRAADEDIDHTCTMSVKRLCRLTELLLDRERSAEALRHAATHDPLTGLPNRAQFFADLRNANARATSVAGQLVGVLYIDLDGFKPVNDQHGHSAGDHVLRVLARRFERVVRAGDVVCRLGGDEFAVVCSDVPSVDVLESVAERIVAAAAEPVVFGDTVLRLGASAGVTAAVPAGVPDQALIDAADAALYKVKSHGAGGWELGDATSIPAGADRA